MFFNYIYLQLLELIICNYLNYILVIYLQIEVFAECGVFCDRRPLAAAKHSKTASSCARSLLIGIFDKETLLKSSLRGGKSRTLQDDNQKCSLNKAKVSNVIFGQFILRIVYLNECIVHNMFKSIKHL